MLPQVLSTMDASSDWHTAAQLIRRLPINMRKDLLNRMDSPVAARILQVCVGVCLTFEHCTHAPG
jgi:hypothetical protein